MIKILNWFSNRRTNELERKLRESQQENQRLKLLREQERYGNSLYQALLKAKEENTGFNILEEGKHDKNVIMYITHGNDNDRYRIVVGTARREFEETSMVNDGTILKVYLDLNAEKITAWEGDMPTHSINYEGNFPAKLELAKRELSEIVRNYQEYH
ncbi:MAG: hypothetical protein ACOYT4_02960 [Nanoarchaeota archaeon]